MAEGVTATGRDWLTVVRRRAWIIAQVAVVCLLASIVAGRVQREQFQTYSEVMLYQRQEGRRSGSEDIPTLTTSVDPKLQTRLVTSPEMITAIAEACGLPQTDRAKAALARAIGVRIVEESKGTTVARILVTGPRPTECADIADAAARLFVDRVERDARAAMEQGLAYVGDLVSNAEKELALTEARIKAFRESGPPVTMSDDAGAGTRLGNYSSAESELASLAVELATAQRELADVKAKLRTEPKTREQKTSVRSPFSEQIRKEIMDLSRRRRELLQEYTESSFEVQAVDKQIDELTRDLAEEQAQITDRIEEQPNNIYETLRTQEVTLESKIASLRGRQAAVQRLLAQRTAEVATLPGDQTEVTRLLRHQRVQEQIYTVFLQRKYEMELESRLQQPKAAEVSRTPSVPEAPFSPNRKLYAVIGLVAGILLGLIVAGLVDQLDDTFGDASEVARYVGAPSLGTVPVAPADILPLPVLSAPVSSFAEAVRSVVVGIQAGWGETPSRLLLFAGPQGGEGVSLLAVNAAAAFAEAGRSVLLVDANMRRPIVHAIFDLPREGGLAEAINESAVVTELIKPTRMPGLLVLTAGAEVANPGALLGSEKARRVWEALRDVADLVVIDVPPVVGLPDAAMVAVAVEASVLVLERGTKRHRAQDAADLLRRAGAAVLGCIRNRERGVYEALRSSPE